MDESATDFHRVLEECFVIGKRVTGLRGTFRLAYAVGVYTRQLLAGYTIWRIAKPRTEPDLKSLGGAVISDFASAFVILRSVYETLLSAKYLLRAEKYDRVRHVILLVSRLHAQREKLVLGANMKSDHPKGRGIERLANILVKQIKEHREYAALPERTQGYVDSPHVPNKKWHNDSMESLAEMAGFHKSMHVQAYKFFSNYTHADPLSIEQVDAVRSPSEAREMMAVVDDYVVIYLSQTLSLLRSVAQEEDLNIPVSAYMRDIIESWRVINAQDLSRSELTLE